NSCFLYRYAHGAHPHLHSFPTRRSSDLHSPKVADQHYLAVTDEMRAHATIVGEALPDIYRGDSVGERPQIENTPVGGCKDSLYGDRKSTRLNSSHEWISYAVFCLKNKTL